MTYGDPSPGNFFFDGRRLGVIDFEDLSIGAAERDFALLDNHLVDLNAQWYYRGVGELRQMLGMANVDNDRIALYELERVLDRMRNPHRKRGLRDVVERMLGESDSRKNAATLARLLKKSA